MSTEADTCRKFVLPKFYAAGWNDDQISEQRTFTDGRIRVAGTKVWRRPQKRADYLLRHRANFMLAVVEAKAVHKAPEDGIQQAKLYAEILKVIIVDECHRGSARGESNWREILEYFEPAYQLGMTATRNFADPAFDGDPAFATQEEIDQYGKTKNIEIETPEEPEDEQGQGKDAVAVDNWRLINSDGPVKERKKYYFDGGQVEIVAELVHELDPDGKQLRVVKLTDYTAEKVRTLCASPDELRARWADAGQRADIIQQLAERGIDFATVAAQAGKPDADPFDLLCHLAFNAPVLTRRQRADRVKKQQAAFFAYFGPEAREILNDLLEKYATDGELQFTLPDVLKVPPISQHGNVNEIIGKFGGAEKLRNAVNQLQTLLYAA